LNARSIVRLLLFLMILAYTLLSFLEYASLVDFMGQFIIEYDSEMFLIKLLGFAIGSILLNYFFLILQTRNTLSELIYCILMCTIYIVYGILISFIGIWLFGEYKYAVYVYWVSVISNIGILTLYLCVIRRHIKKVQRKH
jgi:hypothetical protein